MDPLFPAGFDWVAASDDELREFVAAAAEVAESIGADPKSYITDERPKDALLAEMKEGVAALEEARAELAARAEAEPAPGGDGDGEGEGEGDGDEPDAEAQIADLAALAARSEGDPEPDPEAEPAPELASDPEPGTSVGVEVDVEVDKPEPVVTAAAPPAVVSPTAVVKPRPVLPRPARARSAAPQESTETRMPVSMTASAGAPGFSVGDEIDALAAAAAMIKRRNQFGIIAEGTRGEQMPIARLGWDYPEERRLNDDIAHNMSVVASVADPDKIKAEFRKRRDAQREGALTASGGLCAPVTPYYNLMQVQVADRPVRAALPGFNADRGGLRFAAPATIADVSTAVGIRTVAEDFAGGTEGAKTCQVIDCPPFSEVDVQIIFHCLQFGNLGARAFPELVAHWNNLVLAAHARTAETALLDGIQAASTAVTANNNALGASASLLGQILAAANAMRNRHRMDPEAVLRIMLPDWSLDLLLSDIIRGQFQRFDATEEGLTALLRSFDLEPTFFIDGATGAGQVFGAQGVGALLAFPSTVRWYLFPEGSFLYLDGGTLELGLVRDSVLNASNDFQIFGESFENVAFVGVESLAVTSNVCDSGAVSIPVATECPQVY